MHATTKLIVIDTEYGPTQHNWLLDRVTKDHPKTKTQHARTLRKNLDVPPGNLKDPEKIAAWRKDILPKKVKEAHDAQIKALRKSKESLREAYLKAGHEAGSGELYCIGVGIYDTASEEQEQIRVFFHDAFGKFVHPYIEVNEDGSSVAFSGEWEGYYIEERLSEADMINRFASYINEKLGDRRPTWLGHYSNTVDIPYIWKRSMITGGKPPKAFPRLTEIRAYGGGPAIDTRVIWTGGPRDHLSLDNLCLYLEIPGKETSPINGSEVFAAMGGKIPNTKTQPARCLDVAKYCGDDVWRTLQAYLKMKDAT